MMNACNKLHTYITLYTINIYIYTTLHSTLMELIGSHV